MIFHVAQPIALAEYDLAIFHDNNRGARNLPVAHHFLDVGVEISEVGRLAACSEEHKNKTMNVRRKQMRLFIEPPKKRAIVP